MSKWEIWINRIVTVAIAAYEAVQYVIAHWPGLIKH